MSSLSKKKIGELLGHPTKNFVYTPDKSFVLPTCAVGLEFELEGMAKFWKEKTQQNEHHNGFALRIREPARRNNLIYNKYWNYKQDGSLRNNGIEFVSQVIFGKDLVNALASINKCLKKYPPTISNRCSTHVHLDIRDLTTEEFLRLILDYTIFEKVLFTYAGIDRYNNLYCLPYGQTEWFKKQISNLIEAKNNPRKIYEAVIGFQKYSALNITAAQKFGSVEFRHFPGTTDIKKITAWINIIMCLKKHALGRTANQSLPETVSGQGLNKYAMEIFGKDYWPLLKYKNWEIEALNGLRLAQDILYYYKSQNVQQQWINREIEKVDKPPMLLVNYIKTRKIFSNKSSMSGFTKKWQQIREDYKSVIEKSEPKRKRIHNFDDLVNEAREQDMDVDDTLNELHGRPLNEDEAIF